MTVFSSRELHINSNDTSYYERTEAFHRGIAMQVESFFDIKSDLLNGTFLEYLTKNKMI